MNLRITSILSKILLVIGLIFMQISAINALTISEYYRECERRNLLVDGCDCNCRELYDEISPGQILFVGEICKIDDSSFLCEELTFTKLLADPYSFYTATNTSNIDGDIGIVQDTDFFGTVSTLANTTNGVIMVGPDGNINVAATTTRVFFFIFLILVILSLIMGLVGGYNIITAGADDEKVKTGSSYFRNAVIGLAISFLGIVIVTVVATATNFSTQQQIDTIIRNNPNVSNPQSIDELNCLLFGTPPPGGTCP